MDFAIVGPEHRRLEPGVAVTNKKKILGDVSWHSAFG
jgi:hypothetical protein